QRSSQGQPRDEAHHGATGNVAEAWERFSIEGERSIGIAYDDRDVLQDKSLAALAGAPCKIRDHLLCLLRALLVVVGDGPQTRFWSHGRSSVDGLAAASERVD